MKNSISKRFMFVLALLCAGIFAFSTTSMAKEAPKEIKVGVVMPLSGPVAWAGASLKAGCELAVNQINAKGGVFIKEYDKKIPLKAYYEDCQSKPAIGVAMAEKLVTKDKVNFLVGDAFHSSVTMAIMELAPKYNLPMQSFMPVSEAISDRIVADPKKYWNFWKGDFASSAYGKTIAQTYAYLDEKGLFKPKQKTVAFVIEDTDFGRSNADISMQLMKKNGWKQVAYEVVPLGHNDFYPQLTKLKASRPDVVVSCFTALNSGVSFVKQFSESGLGSSHMGIFYPLYPQLVKQAGNAAEFLMWTPLLLNPDKNPIQAKFQAEYKKAYGKGINNQNAAGYDGMLGVAMAFEAAGSLDPKKVVKALSQADYQGVLGRYKYNQERHEIMDGVDFIPIPTAQIIKGKSNIIWPPSLAGATYQKEPWIQ